MENFFRFKELGTDIKTEILAGITTFFTMAYIIIVNPKILAVAGIPYEASITATILVGFIGCLIAGLFVKRPFGIAPYVGEAVFISYTVVLALGCSWQSALAAVFISGLILFILTLLKIRPRLVNSLPQTMKLAFTVGLGFFLILVGFKETGIIKFTTNSIPLSIGNMLTPTILLAIFGFVLIAALMHRKIKGAILIGIATTTILGILTGNVELPSKLISMPPSIMPILWHLDFSAFLNIKFLPVFFIIFLLISVDTMGCMLGTCYKANLLDEKGNLPEIEKPMLADSATTMISSSLGTVTSGVYLESVTGIEAGGKSGFTAVVVSILFLLGLFFAPLFTIIPPYAYGGAIIIVGMLMVSVVTKLDFDDITEYMPALFAIATMIFAYNIGVGITAGFILYPLLKALTGKIKETNPTIWVLALFSLVFFIVYPY